MLKRSASRGVSHLRLRFFFVGKFRLIDLGISGEGRGMEDVWKDGGLIVWDAVWRKVCLVEMRWKMGWMDKRGCFLQCVSSMMRRRVWISDNYLKCCLSSYRCYFIINCYYIYSNRFKFLKYFSSFRSQSFRFFPLLLLFSNSSRNWV